MTIIPPSGWANFSGGGIDPSFCVENNPPLSIVQQPGTGANGAGESPALSCVFGDDQHEMFVDIIGGVEPFIVTTSAGSVDLSGRQIHVTIAPTPPQVANEIAFFRPLALYLFTKCHNSGNCTGGIGIDPANTGLVATTVDVRLAPYDCIGRHMSPPGYPVAFVQPGDVQVDSLPPDYAGSFYAHPLGDNVSAREATLFINFAGQQYSSGDQLSDDTHWSVYASHCMPDGDVGSAIASVKVAVQTALQNGVHGAIWSGAPAYSETKFIPIQFEGAASSPECHDGSLGIYSFNFDNYIDVRSQAQVDSGCCLLPVGEDIVLTVTDGGGTTAVMIISVK